MDTRKFQGLRVTHVKERLTSYRLQLNDNSIIDIPRIELGGFVPQKGMFVRYRFYRGLILQKIEFDGKTVVNRTPAEIMNLLCRVDAKLEEDVRRQQSACENEDLVFDGLSEIMKQRIFLVQSIGQHPEIGGFPEMRWIMKLPAVQWLKILAAWEKAIWKNFELSACSRSKPC